MTGRIHRLPREIVDRIAAGEVVERPSSVVKELIENSLDAGATRIDVEVRGGGRESIVVRDDGVGIVAEDLAPAFESHATSKLSDVGDLDHIASFGFRGEALASIAAISDCRILSRERGSEQGHEIECRGGNAGEVRVAASPPGTVVEARQLFKYVPARRKFLKSPATEGSHVATAVQNAALAHPEVGFSLTKDGEVAFRVGAADDRRERIARFFGRTLGDSLIPVAGQDDSMSVSGYVARPDAARPSAAWQHYFLNGRPIRDRTIQHAVRHGYEGLLTRDQFPVAILFLTMDPSDVDVNVHPAKTEVRFRDSDRVHRLVEGTVQEALRKSNLAPAAFSPHVGARNDPYVEGVREALTDFLSVPRGPAPFDRSTATPPATSPPPNAVVARPAVRYLQVRDTFIVFETEDGIAVVDQHALHERILLEELKARIHGANAEVQRLLVPTILEFPAADVDLLVGEAESLAQVGIQIGRFGPTSLALHSMPTILSSRDPARILGGVLERLREGGRAGDRGALLETLLHSMACRAAIMAGDKITETQAAELLRRADLIDSKQGCAHGRPTALRIAFSELERRFRR